MTARPPTARRSRNTRPHASGRTWPAFLAVLALVAAVAGIELYAVATRGRADHGGEPAAVVATVAPTGIVGSIDAPAADALVGPNVTLSGWALDAAGIASVEVRLAGRTFAARYGLPRPDVAQARPGYPDSATPGFEFTGDLSAAPAGPGVDRRTLRIVAIARDGRETVLGSRDLIERAALTRFQDLAPAAPTRNSVFHVLPALSGIRLGGAQELDAWYTSYTSSTMRTGMRVPILYLRTTLGAAADYAFDPDWDIERRCGQRRIAEDSLGHTIAYAVQHRIPVLFTLNGGVWADASCDVPAWDVNDQLEQDLANCQWNEKNEVMADDYLRHLPGSQEAPELARTLTFNAYARDVRHYKRRNLQQAGALIAAFAREHPELFVGVNLDPDTYLNPFFDQAQWYDYNPGTLRQFREWLSGTGAYAGKGGDGVPDLRRYRRPSPLTLAQVGRLAGKHFARWVDVDPPRSFPREPKDGRPAFWDDPWTREWEIFRRHLVDMHYDELSAWLAQMGIPAERIWSSQGFMAPHESARPFAIHITSPMKNYDTGGMSIEGAIPSSGHLGAILYGASAVNAIRMESPASLFATFRALDPAWAVVEINTADLRHPEEQPSYAAGYRSLRDVFNYGGRFVSPMAWNGSNGVNAGKAGYVTFTAWRNTPFEDAARDFMLSHANVPVGARLWTFGSPRHTDHDGWTAVAGTMVPEPGALTLVPDGDVVALVSPGELAFDPGDFDRLVLGLEDASALRSVRVMAREDARRPWRAMAEGHGDWANTTGGVAVDLPAHAMHARFDQLRIELRFAAGTRARLLRVALWPRAASARRP